MYITLKEYLENPMGKGNAVLPNKELIIRDLEKRYEKLMQKKKFEPVVYRSKDSYFLHFMIPTETDRDNTYDVVIQFDPEDEKLKYDNFTHRYKIRFFSNCPSFTFTYAYVYNDNDLIVKFLRKKYNKINLTDKPSMRNPNEIIAFEKSTYFACLYIKKHSDYTNKMMLNQKATKLNELMVFNSVRSTDQILMEIDKSKQDLKKKQEEELKKKADAIRRSKKSTPAHAITSKLKTTGMGASHVIKPVTAKKSTVRPKKKI